MPKRKTTETEIPAVEGTASPKLRKTAEKPKASAAAHKHTRKATKPVEVEVTVENATKAHVAIVAVPAHSGQVVAHEDIARLAYSFWEARGCQGGSPHEDWLRAEHELLVFA
jgi:hypothetical protein